MGLGITVGMLQMFQDIGETEGVAAFRVRFDKLAAALEREGVTGYREPDRVPRTMRAHTDSFPYSFLHYLRRCYALLSEERPVTPAADDDALEADKGIVGDASSMMSSHLLCHSDAEGYYVPVQFGDPLFLDEGEGVAGGGMVGSSQKLLGELRDVGPHIGVKLEADGTLSDAEAARLAEYAEDAPFWREIIVWLALHEACVASIAHGSAIVFH